MTNYPNGPHLTSCEQLCSTENVICLPPPQLTETPYCTLGNGGFPAASSVLETLADAGQVSDTVKTSAAASDDRLLPAPDAD